MFIIRWTKSWTRHYVFFISMVRIRDRDMTNEDSSPRLH